MAGAATSAPIPANMVPPPIAAKPAGPAPTVANVAKLPTVPTTAPVTVPAWPASRFVRSHLVSVGSEVLYIVLFNATATTAPGAAPISGNAVATLPVRAAAPAII